MKTKILIVEDTFSIRGRGLVICGQKTDEFVDFKFGNSIEIYTVGAGGEPLSSKIRGIELICRRPNDDSIICFLVEKEISKQDVPKNSPIWLLTND